MAIPLVYKIKYFLLLLRPKQWVKNLFIFIPLIFGKKFFSFHHVIYSSTTFFIFCIVSGVAYIFNDIQDLENDKVSPVKASRPLVSNKINIKEASLIACFLGILGILWAFYFNLKLGLLVSLYLFINLLYSKILKKIVIIDVFCIAGFFLLRIVAGAVVIQVEVSHWLIFMIILLALFLGFNKRRREIENLKEKAILSRDVLERYDIYFIDQMNSIIAASIVATYMLYTIDLRTVNMFGTKNLIYTIPFVYYGIFRFIYLMHKKEVDSDPVNVLFSDFKMKLNIVLWVLVCFIVIYF